MRKTHDLSLLKLDFLSYKFTILLLQNVNFLSHVYEFIPVKLSLIYNNLGL